eukprot:TRINITY_DN8696_c0_g1_i1.p1 TRINITY_DN8696_c0_g1~~TRINITY_DN8696_c0_g1_i1.p1  ORF type:complete len:476 (+),score=56.03 TRINITY_DN8696_c0_g1_i1:48-1475(+)
MGQKTSKADRGSQSGLVELMIDDILLKNDVIFESHINITLKAKKLDEIAASLDISDLEPLLWQKYLKNNVAKALIVYIAIRFISSAECERTKEEKRSLVEEIIRLTALDSGCIQTTRKPPDGRGTSVRQIVWHQASLGRIFDDEQQLLDAFYKAMYLQIVDGVSVEQLAAADASNVPVLLLRQSFTSSLRGPAVYILKVKPWKERSIRHEMIHCMQRIWKFAELVDPTHESTRLLRLNYMRLVALYYHHNTSEHKFSLASALSCADSFQEWFDIRSTLTGLVMSQELEKALIQSILPKFVQFCRREPRQHTYSLSSSEHIIAAVDLLLQNIKKTHNQETVWVLRKALSVLCKRELAHKLPDSSTQPACDAICAAIRSQLAPLLEQTQKMETLCFLSMDAFCEHVASQSRRRLQEIIADLVSRLPVELSELLIERLLYQVLLTKADALAEAAKLSKVPPVSRSALYAEICANNIPV